MFNNNSDQKERRQFVRDSYHTRANADASLEQSGRFAKPQAITGKDPSTLYPRIQSGPWSAPDPSGQEASFGIDVNEPVVTGESFEVEQSLNAEFAWRKTIRDGTSTNSSDATSPPDAVGVPGVGAVVPPDPTVDNSSIVDRPGIVPLPMSEGGVTTNGDCKGAPSSKSQPKPHRRRLV
jgi:hypothetical protein